MNPAGPNGKDPVISWSDLTALYELPDGSKWAEHGYFEDKEDLEKAVARVEALQPAAKPPGAAGPGAGLLLMVSKGAVK